MAQRVERTEKPVTRVAAVTDDDVRRRKYGVFNIGAAFFGWLVAVGLEAMLFALLAAIGSVTAITALKDNVNIDTSNLGNSGVNTSNLSNEAETIGLVGGILVLLAMAIAYYAGGYVAGRMSRFDGARQGFGVALISVLIVLVLAILAVVLGNEYNLLGQLNLPRIPVDEGDLTTGGLVTLLVGLLVMFGAAMAGGKAGQRYHDKIDNTGVER